MVMNIELQKIQMRKIIIKNCREREIHPDTIAETDWEDLLDNSLEFSENISEFYRMGILVETRDHNYKPTEKLQAELKFCLAKSISYPWYTCCYEDCHGCANYKEGIIEHYQEAHGLKDSMIPPENPYDMTYIVLDELINVAFSKKYIKKVYFTISNRHLWLKLIERLGYEESDDSAPSNQKPRQILDKLGLLGEHKYQRKASIGFNKHSQRVYHVNKKVLEHLIYDLDYDDLKFRFPESP